MNFIWFSQIAIFVYLLLNSCSSNPEKAKLNKEPFPCFFSFLCYWQLNYIFKIFHAQKNLGHSIKPAAEDWKSAWSYIKAQEIYFAWNGHLWQQHFLIDLSLIVPSISKCDILSKATEFLLGSVSPKNATALLIKTGFRSPPFHRSSGCTDWKRTESYLLDFQLSPAKDAVENKHGSGS